MDVLKVVVMVLKKKMLFEAVLAVKMEWKKVSYDGNPDGCVEGSLVGS